MLPSSSCPFPAWITRLIAVGLACVFFAAPVAAAEDKADGKRELTHAPQAPQPAEGTSAEYIATIGAHSRRYHELYRKADLTAALGEARAGVALAQQAGQQNDEVEFLRAALYVSWLLGLSAAGLEHGERLAALAELRNDDRLRSFTHRVIGSIFRQLGNVEQMRERTQLALTCAERAGDTRLRIAALNNLGNVALDAGDLPTARRLHQEVLTFREEQGYRWDAAGSLTNLGDVAVRAGEWPEALDLYQRALAIRRELDDRRGQVRSLREVASVLRRLGRADQALPLLVDARARAEKIGGHELQGGVYAELALVHEARREFPEALAFERLAAGEREALASERVRLHASELEARFALGRQQQVIASLDRDRQLQAAALRTRDAELSRSQTQRIGLAGALVLGLVAVGALISRHRLKLSSERRILADAQAAQVAAEEADRSKTRFLGIASHDVRTPLGNIVTLTRELREKPPTAPFDPAVLDLIGNEAERVSTLVQDLLDIAALEVGRFALHRAPLDLQEIVQEALAQYRWQAAAKRVSLEYTTIAPGVAQVDGDSRRLLQVAANLISNAIKFTPSGSRVTASLAREADRVVFSVRDQGPGFTPEDIARLFQPFTPLSARTTAGESSHGLGLSIAHEIVGLHGGVLRVDPTPGQGANFRVELPAQS